MKLRRRIVLWRTYRGSPTYNMRWQLLYPVKALRLRRKNRATNALLDELFGKP